MKEIKKYYDVFILLGLSIIAFQTAIGFEKFNPSNISWLFEARNDWASHHLGWCFFRDTAWQFPLGTVDSYNYPIGTNIGYTDSIPLFAIFFKTISFLLPDNFQYLGIWLFLCQFLNGYYSFKIFQYFKFSKIISFLFVIVILLNPVFLLRQLHPALCAQWLIIGSIYLYLSTNRITNYKKSIKHHLLLLFLSCFITPYLTVVVFGFFAIFIFKLLFYDKAINLINSLVYFLISSFIVFSSWVVIGLINFVKHVDNDSTGFYGLYKFNLNGLYNPLSFSEFLPNQKIISGYQQDAFAYLGFGMILIIILSLVFSIKIFVKKRKIFFCKKLTPLLIFCFLLTIFATTNTISFNDKNLFTIPIPDKILYLGDVFRASGRFFWSVYYLIIFYFIYIFNKIPFNDKIKTASIVLLVVLQLYDIQSVFHKKENLSGDYKPNLNIEFWNNITSNFKNIITVMPFNNDLVSFQDYQEIAFLASKNHASVSNGNLARNNGDAMRSYTNELVNDIVESRFSLDNLYITNKENLKYFGPAYKKGLVNIINSDGYYFIYLNTKKFKITPDNLTKDKAEFEIAKKENLKSVEFELVPSALKESMGEIKYNFDNELITKSICQLSGWAFIENTNNNTGDSIFLYLKNDKYLYKNKCVLNTRKDITIVYKKENLDNSGFSNFTFLTNLEKGKYELIPVIKDQLGNFYYSKSNKIVNIGFNEINTPTKISEKLVSDQDLVHGIDFFEYNDNILSIKGWAAYKKFDSRKSIIEILLIKKEIYSAETISAIRKDVTESFKNNINYDDSGFETKIKTKDLPVGNYSIGIRIINKENKKDAYIITDKKLEIK